jgi:microcompartment protein CcmL/EutN
MTPLSPPEGASPLPATGPALGLVETASVARGMVVADAMVKRALVTLVRAHPTTPGKFIVLIAGGEEEVEQAMGVGQDLAADTLVDRLYLPKADPQLAPALGGVVQVERLEELDTLGIVETFSVAAAILSADRAVKAAAVRLVQLRLARGLGGRAFYVLTGELHQVEAGVEAGRSIIHDGMLLTTEIIARPHADLLGEILLGGDERQLDPSRR